MNLPLFTVLTKGKPKGGECVERETRWKSSSATTWKG